MKGISIKKQEFCIGDFAFILSGIVAPALTLFAESPYVETESDFDEYLQQKEMNEELLEDDWVCWNKVMYSKYGTKVRSSLNAVFYFQESAIPPRFSENLWDIVYLDYDSTEVQIFARDESLLLKLRGCVHHELVEYPGLINDDLAMPFY